MEKYFVTQISNTTDSEAYAIATTVKDTEKEALALYHQILASIYANDNINHAIVDIQNAYGSVIFMENIMPNISESEG